MSLITSFSTDDNFWVLNPQFKVLRPFKKLHDSDRSRNKETSSKIMWFVAQALDDNPSNIFKNVGIDERIDYLSADYMADKDYYNKKEDILQPLMDKYLYLHTTIARKSLQELQDKLVDRAKFIKETEYTLDTYDLDPTTGKPVIKKGTAKDLDIMMKNTKGIYDLLFDIEKALKGEDESNQVKGGQNLSLSDTGDI